MIEQLASKPKFTAVFCLLLVLLNLWLPVDYCQPDYNVKTWITFAISFCILYMTTKDVWKVLNPSRCPLVSHEELEKIDHAVQCDCDELGSTVSSSSQDISLSKQSIEVQKSDEEVFGLIKSKSLAVHQLESFLKPNFNRAVRIRRAHVASILENVDALSQLPFENYDYSVVHKACCENVIGYVPVPVGYAGPLVIDDEPVYVPLATTEGALVASINRGCRAISSCGGVKTVLSEDFMSRAPVIEFDNAQECLKLENWIKNAENFQIMKQKFDGTSRFVRLKSVEPTIVDRLIFLRFCASTGDAMGMNMVSKATDAVLEMLSQKYFPSMRILSLSGNYCSDKKPAAINWIRGRGKRVVAECVLSKDVILKTFRATVESMVHLHISKNLIGSAMAGVCGGYNAHAANMVTAVFLACGQDVAQNVSSSQCLTALSATKNGDLRISCTMPCIEVGTVGGGTILPAQRSCLQMLGCAGGHPSTPGAHAAKLARVVCSTVVAGELSLLAALCSGDLVRSHMKHNRSFALLADAAGLSASVPPQRPSSRTLPISGLARVVDMARSKTSSSSMRPETCSKVIT